MRTSRVFTAVLATVALGATPAFAADPARDGYNTMPISVPPTVKGASETGGCDTSGQAGTNATTGVDCTPVAVVTTPKASSAGSLPFTGLDVGMVAGASLLLLGLGFALRRGTRSEA